MKSLLRNFLINLGALWTTTHILPTLSITGGGVGLIKATFIFMVGNILLIPFLKLLLLPLNLLTLGLFAWLSNVLLLYFLVTAVPVFQLLPYNFLGSNINGFIIPAMNLTVFQTAILASFIIGGIIHFLTWVSK